MQPNIVFIILSWNGKTLLETCLRSVFRQTYPRYSVVVVDNGSTDGSADFVRNNFPAADLLVLPENCGYPKGNNAGIKYALTEYPFDYVLLLNNDMEIRDSNWLAVMVAAAESSPDAGLLGCMLVFPDGRIQQAGSAITPYGFPGLKLSDFPKDLPPLYEVDAVIGAVFMIKRKVLDAIGLLDEGFSPFFAEDMDYCARVRKAGYRIVVVRAAEVVHYTSQTINRMPSAYSRLAAKRGEIRFKLLNLSLPWLMKFAIFEARNFAAQLFERKDKNGACSPSNIVFRVGFRENAACFCRAYFHNLRNLPEIIAKRLDRTRKESNRLRDSPGPQDRLEPGKTVSRQSQGICGSGKTND